MLRFILFTFFCLATDLTYGYLESVATSVIGQPNDEAPIIQSTEPFSAMVAFRCGYRNRYFSKEGGGSWITDLDPEAGCLTGKLDILKYCRKVYPGSRITNIVESTREYELPSWCKLEGHPCKSTFKVKPYRCIVGNFESEALLVPEHCHFGHVDDQKICREFDYWNQTAKQECDKQRPEVPVVKSFAMLEPCGLDMFSGVEFVCCPKNMPKAKAVAADLPTIDMKVKIKVGDEQARAAQTPSADDDESSDEDSEDDDDEQESSMEQQGKKSNASQSVKKRVLTTAAMVKKLSTQAPTKVKEVQTEGGDDDDDDDSDEKAATTEDPYFRLADPDREYMVYRAAIDRLERKHRQKVTEALKKLSEAESKYEKNQEHDQGKVNALKADFKHTMSILEREHHQERHRVEQVHEQRVTATLNERKRQAIKLYQQALSSPNAAGQPQTHRVMRALQAYIRAEEKDRMHSLNRYRFLLRADADEAKAMKDGLIKKLHEIDLRINGTIEMAKEVQGLMEKIKPAIVEFWQTFRDENTPGRVDASLTWIGEMQNGEKLVEFYKKLNELNFKKDQQQIHHHGHPKAINDHHEKESDIRAPVIPQTIVVSQKLDHKGNGHVEQEEMKHAHAFSLKESFQHAAAMKEEVMPTVHNQHNYGYVVLSVAGVTLLMAMVIGVVVFRRRCSMHAQGFMAVDPMTPEERHVSGMQVNGYENPTYKYFEKPA